MTWRPDRIRAYWLTTNPDGVVVHGDPLDTPMRAPGRRIGPAAWPIVATFPTTSAARSWVVEVTSRQAVLAAALDRRRATVS